jgi:hypothetical protein
MMAVISFIGGGPPQHAVAAAPAAAVKPVVVMVGSSFSGCGPGRGTGRIPARHVAVATLQAKAGGPKL